MSSITLYNWQCEWRRLVTNELMNVSMRQIFVGRSCKANWVTDIIKSYRNKFEMVEYLWRIFSFCEAYWCVHVNWLSRLPKQKQKQFWQLKWICFGGCEFWLTLLLRYFVFPMLEIGLFFFVQVWKRDTVLTQHTDTVKCNNVKKYRIEIIKAGRQGQHFAEFKTCNIFMFSYCFIPG